MRHRLSYIFITIKGKDNGDKRPARLTVAEHHFAAMILDDFLYYSQSQPGTLLARGDIWLQQTRHEIHRKARTIISDFGDKRIIPIAKGNKNFARWQVGSSFSLLFRCFGRVFEQIGKGAGNLLRIAKERGIRCLVFQHVAQSGMGHFFRKYHAPQQGVQLLMLENWRRHAGEGHEFLHHLADIRHMADNGIEVAFKSGRILSDLLAVFAPQPLGGKLDGG